MSIEGVGEDDHVNKGREEKNDDDDDDDDDDNDDDDDDDSEHHRKGGVDRHESKLELEAFEISKENAELLPYYEELLERHQKNKEKKRRAKEKKKQEQQEPNNQHDKIYPIVAVGGSSSLIRKSLAASKKISAIADAECFEDTFSIPRPTPAEVEAHNVARKRELAYRSKKKYRHDKKEKPKLSNTWNTFFVMMSRTIEEKTEGASVIVMSVLPDPLLYPEEEYETECAEFIANHNYNDAIESESNSSNNAPVILPASSGP